MSAAAPSPSLIPDRLDSAQPPGLIVSAGSDRPDFHAKGYAPPLTHFAGEDAQLLSFAGERVESEYFPGRGESSASSMYEPPANRFGRTPDTRGSTAVRTPSGWSWVPAERVTSEYVAPSGLVGSPFAASLRDMSELPVSPSSVARYDTSGQPLQRLGLPVHMADALRRRSSSDSNPQAGRAVTVGWNQLLADGETLASRSSSDHSSRLASDRSVARYVGGTVSSDSFEFQPSSLEASSNGMAGTGAVTYHRQADPLRHGSSAFGERLVTETVPGPSGSIESGDPTWRRLRRVSGPMVMPVTHTLNPMQYSDALFGERVVTESAPSRGDSSGSGWQRLRRVSVPMATVSLLQPAEARAVRRYSSGLLGEHCVSEVVPDYASHSVGEVRHVRRVSVPSATSPGAEAARYSSDVFGQRLVTEHQPGPSGAALRRSPIRSSSPTPDAHQSMLQPRPPGSNIVQRSPRRVSPSHASPNGRQRSSPVHRITSQAAAGRPAAPAAFPRVVQRVLSQGEAAGLRPRPDVPRLHEIVHEAYDQETALIPRRQ
eukprot:EG_transcript_4448